MPSSSSLLFRDELEEGLSDRDVDTSFALSFGTNWRRTWGGGLPDDHVLRAELRNAILF